MSLHFFLISILAEASCTGSTHLPYTGGRANNGEGVGPNGSGVVGVGVRTLNEAGTVADWSREQVELFCISKLINCVLEPDEEFVFLDFHFAMRE